MEATISEMKDHEVLLKVTEEDIAVMYILQHELILSKKVEYAGFALKHPLTREYDLRVITESGNPLDALLESTRSAHEHVEDLVKVFKSKLRD